MTHTNLEAQQLILSFNNLEGFFVFFVFFFFFFFCGSKRKKICGDNLMDVSVLKQFYQKFMYCQQPSNKE
jgi:hypothetical protein